jgi:hypothetical protein
MRPQPESTPDSHDRILRQACLLCHETSAPMRAVGRHRFQCLRDHVLSLLIADLAWRTNPRLIQQSKPDSLNRSRHFPNVAPVMCSVCATSELLIPSPQLSTIRARSAVACADFGRRVIHDQFRPIRSNDFQRFLGTTRAHTQRMRPKSCLFNVFLAQDTSITVL